MQQLQDLRLDHHVECGGGLVGEQDARVARECHRDCRALAHTARELVREPPRALGADADQLEQLAAACTRAASACDVVQLHRLDDLVADALDRVERVHGALEDHGDGTPAVRSQRVLAAGEDVLAVEKDPARDARIGREQPHQREAERRLPATRLPDQAHALAAREREVGALHGVELAPSSEVEPDVQVLHLQHRRAAHDSSSAGRGGAGRSRKRRTET